jgi:NADH-quinone oxidoreductase subunit M
MLVAAMASLGLPGLSGFWGEFFTFRGAFYLTTIWRPLRPLGSSLLRFTSSGESSRMSSWAYDPAKIDHWSTATGEHASGPTDLVAFEKLTLWPLIILVFVLGIYPTPLLNDLNGAAVQVLNFIQSVL